MTGVALILFGLLVLGTCIALQFDAGLASSLASSSTCNDEPCTVVQLQHMSLFVGPITFLVVGGFGIALLKVPIDTGAPPDRWQSPHH